MMKMLSNCIGAGALLFAALTASAQADCGFGGCDPNGLGGCGIGCGQKAYSCWDYGGWVEAGLYGNNHGTRNVYDNWGGVGPGQAWQGWSGNTAALGPARMADLQMNQLYGYFGKKLDTRCGWDFGGRVDFMYGTDALYTQSNGMEYSDNHDRWGKGDYLASIPQIYAEVGYCNVSLKAGKFYGPLGHEGIMSPNRFFYSTSYAFGITPVTQTGILATWDANSRLSVFGGWTCGEDFGVGDSTFADGDNNAALLGFKYKVNRKVTFGYSALIGSESDYNEWAGDDHKYFVHSFIIGFQPNRCWDYTFEWALRNNNYEGAGWQDRQAAYGINQELIYKYNRCWAFGLRGEWMYNTLIDADSYEVTLGANWTPNNWLLVRPEIRYDYCTFDNGGFKTFDEGNSKGQLGVGVSTIVKF